MEENITMNSEIDIEQILKILKDKLNNPNLKNRFSNFTKNIQFNLTDLDKSLLLKIQDGEIESLMEEKMDRPDINLTVESRILIDILNNKINPMKAYTTGRLKAKGKITDILKLQKFL